MLGMMGLKPSPILTPVVFLSILLCSVICVIAFDRNKGVTWFVTVNIPVSRIAG
jgi:hypothetical protein